MADLSDYEKNDSSFVEDLQNSQQYVWQAAKWLSDSGYNVTIRPVEIRPDVSQMREYSDCGDLEIIQRIEVKHRTLDFTCKDDYPFDTVIVDVAHTYDKARPKPFAYIIFNKQATHCLIVENKSRKQWIKRTTLDKVKKRERTFYECPIELCSFHKV